MLCARKTRASRPWYPCVAAVAALIAGPAPAQSRERLPPPPLPPGDVRPTLRVGTRAGSDITLDGVLSEPVWATVDSIASLTTVEPHEGGAPTGRTVVRVLVTATDIIIGVRCYDPDPRGIVSFTKARDVELDEEDHIMIVLDTFQDGRSGYVFAVNPNVARFDGLISAEGEDVNSNWDTVWEARAARDDQARRTDIDIPIQSMTCKTVAT